MCIRDSDTTANEDVVDLRRGDLLLMYTDGLVERRRTPIDQQIELLAAALGRISVDDDLAASIDHLFEVARAPSDADTAIDDDRAVIAIRRR